MEMIFYTTNITKRPVNPAAAIAYSAFIKKNLTRQPLKTPGYAVKKNTDRYFFEIRLRHLQPFIRVLCPMVGSGTENPAMNITIRLHAFGPLFTVIAGICILALMTFSSCTAPANERVLIDGSVVDSVRGHVLQPVRVMVSAIKPCFCDIAPAYHPLITTSTDTDGNYHVEFVTDGTQSGYHLSIVPSDSIFSTAVISINPPVHKTGVQLQMIAATWATLTIHISDTSRTNSIYLAPLNGPQGYSLYHHTRDTTISIPLRPARNNILHFVYYASPGLTRTHDEIVAVGLETTLNKEIALPPVADW